MNSIYHYLLLPAGTDAKIKTTSAYSNIRTILQQDLKDVGHMYCFLFTYPLQLWIEM